MDAIRISTSQVIAYQNLFGEWEETTIDKLIDQVEAQRKISLAQAEQMRPAIEYVKSRFSALMDEKGVHPDECFGATVTQIVEAISEK